MKRIVLIKNSYKIKLSCMKKYIPLLLLLLFSCPDIEGQTLSDDNFIYTSSPKKAVQAANYNTLTKEEMNQKVTYFDGLGRPAQTIAIGQGGNGEDIVTPVEYDVFGRQIREYLPYAVSNGGNAYSKIDPITALNATTTFYNTDKYESTSNPFSEKKFEPSPLNRVLKQAAPGNSWAMGNGHEIKLEYQTNTTADSVKLYKAITSWEVGSGLYDITFSDAGTYEENQLYKNVTYDENTTATPSEKSGSTVEFKNKEGQVILKRTYDSQVRHDTYYVYDLYGNLTYVLPPKVEGVINDEVLNGLCYQYKYDSRNRLVEKKLPGKQWEFIVYDKLDRPVATGPVFSPFKEDSSVGWLITKYDAFSRPIYTGWNQGSANSATRKSLQDAQNLATVLFESKQTSGTIDDIPAYYSNVIEPTNFKLLSVNYYDNYNYPNAPTIPSVVEGEPVLINVKSLSTGSWTRALTTASATLGETSTTFYDVKARPIRSYVQNHLGGYTCIDSKLDFTGKTLYSISKHKRTSGVSELTIKEEVTYSAQDRLLTHTHQINGGTVELLAANTYDELGQLTSKNVGNNTGSSLQKVDFGYNIRGWLTGINNTENLQQDSDPADLFAFKINYNKQPENSDIKALYNGNISETYWKASSDGSLRSYGYQYDNLNRLTSAIYSKPNDAIALSGAYNESLSYDKNGNIKFLQRYGGNDVGWVRFQIDDLTYDYFDDNPNRLKKVTDSPAGNDSKGFKDGNKTGDDYTYDDNGNMTSDLNKNITEIQYNHLNLPKKITFGTTGSIEYIYNAAGQKLEKNVIVGLVTTNTSYLGGFQYKDNVLEFFPTAEGYVKNTDGVLSYVFQYKDHLGNIRLSYAKNPQTQVLEIIDENHYYPFGLKHEGYTVLEGSNKYKYNGKEFQDDLRLNMYAMDARQYDPAIGRWIVNDPIVHHSTSPYSAFEGNPVFWADPSGAEGEHYDYNTGGYVNSTGQSVSFSEAMASQGLNTDGSKKSTGPDDWIKNNETGEVKWFDGTSKEAQASADKYWGFFNNKGKTDNLGTSFFGIKTNNALDNSQIFEQQYAYLLEVSLKINKEAGVQNDLFFNNNITLEYLSSKFLGTAFGTTPSKGSDLPGLVWDYGGSDYVARKLPYTLVKGGLFVVDLTLSSQATGVTADRNSNVRARAVNYFKTSTMNYLNQKTLTKINLHKF